MRGIKLTCGAIALGLLLLAVPAPAAAEPIQQAIDRGVAALKKEQGFNGIWNRWGIGSTALAGLTLLECGLPPNDPCVQKAADAVREASPSMAHTYTLSLIIMFLDRLGEPADTPLIQALGVRLLAGQNVAGGWTYNCPVPDETEQQRLRTLVLQRNKLVARTELPKLQPGQRPPLDSEVQKQLRLINREAPQGPDKDNPFGRGGVGDNSNTQFAILGLWAARRHSVPIEEALTQLDARFRGSQNGDGGWGYMPGSTHRPGMPSTGAMTCAGLLGLAFSLGGANEAVLRTNPNGPAGGGEGRLLPRDPARDPAVRNGLIALGTAIGQPIGNPRGKGPPPGRGPGLRKGYYFLWSVERVAVAFSLNTIGKKDWYAWGSEILLASQEADGSWSGEHGAEVDTCFALLFLRRANLAKDLTATLKGSIQDPGEVALKAGGVGGADLAKKGIIADLTYGDTAADPVASKPSADMTGEQLQAEAVRLAYELARTPPTEQAAVVEKMKQNKGLVYTQALAAAIPQLQGAEMQKARDALAERLTRMTAATLRDKLKDPDGEIRRAATLACAMKEDKSHIPDLIISLGDQESKVARAAQAGLKYLTGQDLGGDAQAWNAWWEKQAKP
jgi:hypothetical protein